MPQNFRIQISTDATTWTTLSNVQEISASIGRQTLKDPFVPSSLQFVMRYPDGFVSPVTSLLTGNYIRLNNVTGGSGYEMWRGKIADVAVDWGKPFADNVGVQDYVTVSCEGAMADWGRQQGDDYAMLSENAYYALATASSVSGLPVGTTYTPETSPFVSPSTVSSSWLDWINLFATTLSSTVKDGSGQIGVYHKDYYGFLPISFSDTQNDSTHQCYEQIEITSQVENFFTEINIQTNTYGTVTQTYGSPPYRSLPLSTISGSSGQAEDLGNYYLTLYKEPTLGISKIVCRSEAQNSWQLDCGYGWWDILGYRTKVTFRGTTYDMTILGASFTATPSGSVFTYNLQDSSLTPWFVLDSDDYGVLDQNKLSW